MSKLKEIKTVTNIIKTTENTKFSIVKDDFVLKGEYILSNKRRTGELTICKSKIVYIEDINPVDETEQTK